MVKVKYTKKLKKKLGSILRRKAKGKRHPMKKRKRSKWSEHLKGKVKRKANGKCKKKYLVTTVENKKRACNIMKQRSSTYNVKPRYSLRSGKK